MNTPDLFTPAVERIDVESLFCTKMEREYMHALLGDYVDEGRDSYRMLIEEAEKWAKGKVEWLDKILPMLSGRDPYFTDINRTRHDAVRLALDQHNKRRAA